MKRQKSKSKYISEFESEFINLIREAYREARIRTIKRGLVAREKRRKNGKN